MFDVFDVSNMQMGIIGLIMILIECVSAQILIVYIFNKCTPDNFIVGWGGGAFNFLT